MNKGPCTVKSQIRGKTSNYASKKKKGRINTIKEIEDRLQKVELQEMDPVPSKFNNDIIISDHYISNSTS